MLNCMNLMIFVMLYEVFMLLIFGVLVIDIDFFLFFVCLVLVVNIVFNFCNCKVIDDVRYFIKIRLCYFYCWFVVYEYLNLRILKIIYIYKN